MALAKGASMAGSATCSGEGGMIPPERDLSTKWYYQVIQSRYGFNPHHLMLADGVEFFIGQGCKVGLGGHLMGQKVTEQVAEMRSLPAGIDQRSPARHPDWLGPDDLSLKVQETREATNYEVPIQLKLGAARVYDDVRMAAKCGPDIIYLDGAEGGTGAGPHIAAEETGHPAAGGDPRGAPRAGGRRPRRRRRPGGRGRHPQRRRRRQVPGARRRRDRDRPLGADGAQLQQGDPGRHRLRGHRRRPGRPVLPLPHRPLPGRDHDPGPGAAQAPPRGRGGPARLQLPPHAHARGADARPRLRQDERPQPRARGPGRADGRGVGDGEGAAGRHRLHPGRHRGAGARRDPHPARPLPREPGRLPAGAPRQPRRRTPDDPRRRRPRAREGRLDRRRVPLGRALPLPGGHLAGRGHRPRGGDARART